MCKGLGRRSRPASTWKHMGFRAVFFYFFRGLNGSNDPACGWGWQEAFKISRVESGRVRRSLKYHGFGRVEAGILPTSRAGSGHLSQPNPRKSTRHVKGPFFASQVPKSGLPFLMFPGLSKQLWSMCAHETHITRCRIYVCGAEIPAPLRRSRCCRCSHWGQTWHLLCE